MYRRPWRCSQKYNPVERCFMLPCRFDNRVMASAVGDTSQPNTQARMMSLTMYARCIRMHIVTESRCSASRCRTVFRLVREGELVRLEA